MATYSDNKIISLNSLYGIQQNGTYLSNIIFNTGLILEENESIIESHISVINCQIPVSFYTITSNNNILKASFNNGPYTNYVIPVGNYNSYSLITVLQTILQHNIQVTFNVSDGTITFKSSVYMIYGFNFNSPNGAGPILGFLSTSSYTTTFGVITSPFPINLLGVKRLSIKSQYLGVSSFTSQGGDNSLCVIPCDQPPYNMLSYQNPSSSDKQKLNVKMINRIDILIYDENNNLINFNNCNWTLTLCLENTIKSPLQVSTFNEILEMGQKKNNELRDKDLEELDLLS